MVEKDFQDNFYKSLKVNKDIAFGYQKERRLQIINYIERKLNFNFKKKNIKIAEFGCGTGYFSAYILRKFQNIKLDLYDISSSLNPVIDEVMAISNVSKDRYNFYSCDINKDLIKKKYDIVFMCGALHHSYNLKKYFNAIKKSLNSNGLLICQEPAFKEDINLEDLKKYYIKRLNITFNKNMPQYERYDTFFKVSEYLVASRYSSFDLLELRKWDHFMNHPELYVGEKYEKNQFLKLLVYAAKYLRNKYRNIILQESTSRNKNINNYLFIFKNISEINNDNWLPHLDLLGLN